MGVLGEDQQQQQPPSRYAPASNNRIVKLPSKMSTTKSPSTSSSSGPSKNDSITRAMVENARLDAAKVTEAAELYASELQLLKDNNKPTINFLTILAEEQAGEGMAPVVVRAIDAHIFEAPGAAQKLPCVFLIDSILKNCATNTRYRELFARVILLLFTHVFEEGDERVRTSLYKVRRTWSAEIFPLSRLYGIDIKCNEIDPNWPVASVTRPNALSSTVSGQGGDAKAAATTTTAPVPSTSNVFVNPRFIHHQANSSSSGESQTRTLSAREQQLQSLQAKRDAIEKTQSRVQSAVVVPPAGASGAAARDPRLAKRQQQQQQQQQSSADSGKGKAQDVDLRARGSKDRKDKDHDKKKSSSSLKSEPKDEKGKHDKQKKRGRKELLDRYEDEHHNEPKETNTESSDARSSSPDVVTSSKKTKKKKEHKEKSPKADMTSSKPSSKSRSRSPMDAQPSTSSSSAQKNERSLPPKKRTLSLEQQAAEAEQARSNTPPTSIKEELVEDSAFSSGPSAEKRPRVSPRASPREDVAIQQHNANGAHNKMDRIDRHTGQHNPPISRSNLAEPTNRLGAHAFVDRPFMSGAMSGSSTVPSSTMAPISSTMPYGGGGGGPGPGGFGGGGGPMNHGGLLLPPPPFGGPNAPYNPLAGEPLLNPMMAPSSMTPMPPAPPAPAPEPPRMPDAIPANNRIFVDNKMYEVHFVNGDIPVIEREGLPYKIFFAGSPRDVVIDGVAHRLAFGEKKVVTIDGQNHVIRFGAPSKELYMGAFAFRGAFGGPPIYATVNGVKHEIRLCGPPPEVQVEPEPSYDLQRFMPGRQPTSAAYMYSATPATSQPLLPNNPNAMLGRAPDARTLQQQQQTQPQVTSSSGPPMTKAPSAVDSILNQLIKTGLKLPTAASNQSLDQMGAANSPARPTTPPIPSGHSWEDEVVKQVNPPPSLKDFSKRFLKVRYQTCIDALYPTKQRCTNCGLRFDSVSGDKYTRHLDWHFRENRRAQDTSRGQSRPWYLETEDWVTYSEHAEENSKAKSSVFEADRLQATGAGGDEDSNLGVDIPVIDAPDGQHSCPVCSEAFEQFWDENTDSWKLRNAVALGDPNEKKFYHPDCVGDTSLISPRGFGSTESADTTDLFASLGGAATGGLPGLDVVEEDEQSGGALKAEPSPTATTAAASNRRKGRVVPETVALANGADDETTTAEAAEVKREVKTEPSGSTEEASSPRTPGTPVRDE